ncbi:MAG: hypothetical protein AAGG48_11050 [Planctomycetota bacterium]
MVRNDESGFFARTQTKSDHGAVIRTELAFDDVDINVQIPLIVQSF